MVKWVSKDFVAVLGIVGLLNICLAEVPYRTIPLLQATPDTVRPLHLGFTTHSLLPWFGTNEPPALLVMGHAPYFEPRNLIYRAQGKDGRSEAFSLPADYPLYDTGHRFSKLKPSRYIPLKRKDGRFDLVDVRNWRYLVNTGTLGRPAFAKSYEIRFGAEKQEGEVWITDVTGDGIPDALVGGPEDRRERFFMYPDYPKQKGPWAAIPQPNMGILPDADIQNFKGYDIAGNWMGRPVRKYLWWAKGRLDTNRHLMFGRFRKVFQGETRYPVQWECYGDRMSPVVMDLESGLHVILFSGVDQALALPVRGEKEHQLHLGKAVPLLAGSARLQSANHPAVIGVGDFTGDGQDELAIGSGGNGRVTLLAGMKAGEFKELGNLFSRGGPLAGDTLAVPVRADWDRDGWPDLIIGGGSGELSLWNGTADPLVYDQCRFFKTSAGFVRHRPVDGNLQGDNETAWSYIQPEVFDWDGDGKPDLITNDNEAKLFFYRGTGKGVLLEERKRFVYRGKPLPVAWRVRPEVVDGAFRLAGDERPCLLFMTISNRLACAVPAKDNRLEIEKIAELKDENGLPIVLSGPAGLSGRIKLSVADWDGDGKWDILFGCQQALQRFFRSPERVLPTSAPFWMRNIGSNSRPVFQLPQLISFRDGTPIRVGSHNFNVYPTDLDRDGKPDIVFGDDEGFIYYLRRNQLAWTEATGKDLELKKKRFAPRKKRSYRSKEVVFAEDWDYSTGPITPAMNGGKGWESGWQAHGDVAEVFSKSLPLMKGKYATIMGGKKGGARLERALADPLDFSPDREKVFEVTLSFNRQDTSNNGGTEGITLFELTSEEGAVLCAVETTSQEALVLRLGSKVVASADDAVDFGGAYTLNARLVLRPEEQLDTWTVELIPADREGKPVKMAVEAEVDGFAGHLNQRIMKYAGSIGFDNLMMRAE